LKNFKTITGTSNMQILKQELKKPIRITTKQFNSLLVQNNLKIW